MADTITIRTDEETERAIDVLNRGGSSRSGTPCSKQPAAANAPTRCAGKCSA
jgi:hypothetical protein